jgi:hypothetical protein
VKQILIQHGAHIGFVIIGVFVFLWIAYRPQRESDVGTSASRPRPGVGTDAKREYLERMAREASAPAPEPAPGNVRRSVARRGLLALGPLLGAVATGAVLYGIDVGNRPPPGAVIWGHAGISTLALLLVVYKVADLTVSRIRLAFARQRLTELVSVALGLSSVPLAATGVVLLFAPSSQSFMAYGHLISSAWWTGLLAWHLRRYLGPSLRAALRPASAGRGRLVPE